ncbi:MAG: hypothetical protein AB7H92_18825 [Microbacteriaceae bacterium]
MRLALLTIVVALVPSLARAQDDAARERARALFAEAQAHEDGQRWVLAAQTYRQLYDVMSQAGLPRASVALWTAGSDLARVPGREREASDNLRRFLAESGDLASDPEIARYRAEAPRLIAELEARAGPSASPTTPVDPPPQRTDGGATISPVGPILLGVGGAAVVAGIIMGAVAYAQGQTLLERCPTQIGCPSDLRDDEDAARTLAIAGDVTWITGALVAVAGLVLTLVLTDDGGDETTELRLESVPGGGVAALRGGF